MVPVRWRAISSSVTVVLLILAGLFFAAQSVGTALAAPPPGFILGQQLYSSGTGCDITVNTEPVTAAYTSKLWVSFTYPPTSPILLIPDNHVPTTVTFPSPPTGTELVFFITVNETGDTWYVGPGTRNSDASIHAAVKTNSPSNFTVGFEDLTAAEADFDYDDVVFTFQGCLSTTQAPVGGSVTLTSGGDAGSPLPWVAAAGIGVLVALSSAWYVRRRVLR
jgi:hypothetical protein